jgi:hypothetical protein
MKEDYVSFEIAKLLKEKGFDGTCYACYEYFESSVTLYKGWPFEYKGTPVKNSQERIKCPTLQMAMKWLRELYDIHIVIFPSSFMHGDKYTYSIYYKRTKKDENYQLHFQSRAKTFEGAANEAIEHCLTNLI